jgi:hypothetical protein
MCMNSRFDIQVQVLVWKKSEELGKGKILLV